MKQLLLLTIGLLGSLTLIAQDTVRVQTLTWDDDVRSGFYTFPDDPSVSYEKILMRYNMRCHNGAVGNGNVGCREWDYSCNTFITDPTLKDSILRTHPSHQISQFTGTNFPFQNGPYYIYTQYEQQRTTFLDTSNLLVTEIGEGEVPLNIANLTERARAQYLYTAEDLQAAGMEAGPITAMQLDVLTAGTTTPFLRIRLQAVDADMLEEASPVVAGFTEVFFQNLELSATGWVTLPFYQAFNWDGTSDLLIDISSNGTVSEPFVQLAGSQTTGNTGLGATAESQHYLGLQGSGWVDIPSEALGMQQGVTVAFWAYGLPAAATDNTTAFEAIDGANRRHMNVHLPWSDGRVYWDCGNDGSGYDRISKAIDDSIVAGQWNHWAFTKDATNGTMQIYLNGELWHSETGKSRPIMANAMSLGKSENGNVFYPGNIDNFSMWQSALTAEDIQGIMYTEQIPNTHSQIANLIVHYPLNEGTGLVATDVANGYNGDLVGPNWQTFRGRSLQYDWTAINYRPNVRWEQGEHTLQQETVAIIDSVMAYPNTIVAYEVDASNNLIVSDVYESYASTETYLYDEAGNVLATYPLTADGTITITDLQYHEKRNAKLEILSLVTPYGNGLNLGAAGKTFTFDVSDFAPILKGEKFLSMEMGGQFQEQMDIEFWFIKGTPTREVLSIENVWPFARGWYQDIQDNNIFEARSLKLKPDADAHKLRMSVTGHGQNGEFVSRQHYLNVNGGAQDFRFDVWKACGDNPIYPQGGTWIFDRAGWCPGMSTDLHEFMLPDDVGEEVLLDYGVNGSFLSEANYLVSTQLVSYGPPSFSQDAAIVDIVRPSQKVEHERFNPACNAPIVIVENNGTGAITSLSISYGVENGMTATYDWEGSLAFGERASITLPVDDYTFWQSNAEQPMFFAELTAINGSADEYAQNNEMTSAFTPADVFEFENLLIQLRTNNRPAENRYFIRNSSGDIVLQRNNLAAATTYKDDINLPPGCYSLTLEDDGGDGLDFWFWERIGENVGTGTASIRRQLTPTVAFAVKNFNPDFGGDLHYDFIIPQTVNTDDQLPNVRRFSLYPNPARDYTTMELTGFIGETVEWSLVDITGRVLQAGAQQVVGQEQLLQLDTSTLPAGWYTVRVQASQRQYVRELTVLPK